ncbi:calcium-dependent phosphotriesterase [Sistotremastrum niveocremeum HHB9708]|uniref:Calcium-dependent phosphotriesterase n=1 Tax=Sistotremastrum niveocremeum HHB9708 TaxID=1314777 RepID=A0A164TUQ9_9AGAM|nr:calcium-dependent phosphotriesterase [Sistotremastrum niveocremeum HHB9708]
MWVKSSIYALLLAGLAWRLARPGSNILTLPPLPENYSSFGSCAIVKENADAPVPLKYCEDAVFWQPDSGSNKQLIMSCDPNRKEWNTVMGPLKNPNSRGALWLYTPGSPGSAEPIKIKGYPPNADFHPLGIDVLTPSGSDVTYLYAVNHGRDISTIEVFTLSHDKSPIATYQKTLRSLLFRSPNSITLTSANSFYLTHDHFFTRRLPPPMGMVMPMVETMLTLPLAWLQHVRVKPDGKLSISLAAAGLAFANGASLSPDGTELAVASSSYQVLYMYERNPSTNKLRYKYKIEIPYSPDNVSYDDEGGIVVAGHPHLKSLSNVAYRKASHSPSWVVEIRPHQSNGTIYGALDDSKTPFPMASRMSQPETHIVRTLYQSDGSAFSSTSTGLIDSTTGTMYVTGLYEHGLLVCTN